MVVLQRLKNGQHIMTVKKSMVEAANLQPGMELVFMVVGPFVQAVPGDIILRPTGIVKSRPKTS